MGDDLKGLIETEVEISASADKFFNIWKDTSHLLPNITGDHIQAVAVHDGDWDSHGHGSILIWNYTVEGVAESYKQRVELDEENKMVRQVGIEGDVFKQFKSMTVVYHPVPKADNQGSVVKLRLEYEKLDANVPDPLKYLDLMSFVTKDVASHIDKNN